MATTASPHHDRAEILLKLVLNTNQSILSNWLSLVFIIIHLGYQLLWYK